MPRDSVSVGPRPVANGRGVEGEKDVLALRALGLVATTNAGGAGKWHEHYTDQLRGAGVQTVVILPDNDDPGRQHAEAVARSCHRVGLSVKVVELPGLPPKRDVSDWLAANQSRDELIPPLLAIRRPQWAGAASPATRQPTR